LARTSPDDSFILVTDAFSHRGESRSGDRSQASDFVQRYLF